VAVLPDGGDRYLSTNLFTTLLEPDFRFYDFMSREKVDFKPVQEGKVRVFVTAPPLDQALTLQDLRRFLLADLLTRFVQSKGFTANQVVLLPDLESRTIQGALNAKMDLASYTQQQIDLFLGELDRLGIQRAYRYPRITEHLDTIIEHSRALVDKGMAYEKLRSVYWNHTKNRNYGALSRVDLKKIRYGTTVDLDAYEKLHPRDFTLLKRATLAELKHGMCMKTDWGNVLPTWHIAAASVAVSHLGAPIDIHVSSMDFLFPHLENVKEIGEALTGKAFAHVWMLCEQIWATRDEKGTFQIDETTSIQELISRGYSHRELRYWLLGTHYRKPVHATFENIRNAVQGYHRLSEFITKVQQTTAGGEGDAQLPEMIYALEQAFFDAMADDLNVPNALVSLFRFVRHVNPLLDQGKLDGPERRQILDVFGKINGILGIFPLELQALSPEEEELMRRREEARRTKQWSEADRLRQELLSRGLRLEDTSTGTRWERSQ
jgi:cysteinyl-tRNA synthetase